MPYDGRKCIIYRTMYYPPSSQHFGHWNGELHFLMYCPRFENHRRELFSNVLNYNAAILSAEDKFAWILSNEDPACVRELAKFIWNVLIYEIRNTLLKKAQ
jgi:hypothetical protein